MNFNQIKSANKSALEYMATAGNIKGYKITPTGTAPSQSYPLVIEYENGLIVSSKESGAKWELIQKPN